LTQQQPSFTALKFKNLNLTLKFHTEEISELDSSRKKITYV
jgi:hypothetical protein